MPYASTLETAAARRAISLGDDVALERYLRDGGQNPTQTLIASTSGRLIHGTNIINAATGSNVYLLPAATGSGLISRVVIGTTITSGSCIIKAATVADFFVGMMTFGTTTFAAGSTEAIGGTDALITLVAAAGGVKGTVITFTDIVANLWLVQGTMSSTTSASVVGAWA